MNLQFTLAWRYLNGRKLRTFLTTLAVIFGVLVIFGMNIILPTMLSAFQANLLAASGQVDVTLTHKTGGSFPQTEADRLNGIAGIRAYSSSLNRTVNLPADYVDRDPSRPDRVGALGLIGVDPASAQTVRAFPVLNGGRFLEPGDTDAAVISQSLADAYGIGLGGSIRIPSISGSASLTVVGLLPARTTPGNEEVFVPLPQAQALTGQAGQVNTIDIDLNTTDESRRSAILARIESAMGSDFQAGSLQPGSEFYAGIKLGQAAFNLFGALALFMGGFIIFNTFRTVVAERRRDIGMLRAIGASRRTVVGSILVEGLLQGFFGSAVGILAGYVLGAAIIYAASGPLTAFIHLKIGAPVVSPQLVLVSFVLGVGITILSGLLPALSASTVAPMDALRPTVAEVEYKRRSGIASIAGLLLALLSILALISGNMSFIAPGSMLFLIGLILLAPVLLRPIASAFGKLTALLYARQGTGELAQGNLTRQISRVVITSSATMIGLAIVVALGGMTTSLTGMMNSTVHKSLGSDYLFVPPSISVWSSDLGAGPEFVQRLQAIPGVGDISSLRFAASLIDGKAVNLLGIDPVLYPRVSGLDFKIGDESAYTALAAGRAMIVNGAFMAAVGGHVGDTVTVLTPTGTQSYKIVALATDLLDAKVTTAFISQANLAADFGTTEDVFIQMNLKPGASLAEVSPRIKAVAADYPQFTVLEAKSYIDQLLKLLQAVFAGLYFMLAFLALPSLIAMLNTLAISVIERRREIGMLRAVGATRQQVRRMITAEALLLAGVGTAFGILAGLYLGYVIVAAMAAYFPVSYSFPLGGVLAGIAIGLIFGALAAYIPARQASRLQVVEALRYE